MPANECRPDGMNTGPSGMNQGPCGMPGLFGFTQVENVTDDNYTDVQAEMVDALGNMTEMLNSQLDNSTDENMTEMLTEQLTELETLSSEISAASSAAELQAVVFAYVQTQAVDSLEMEVDHLEEIATESENITDENMSENLSTRITELNALIEEINGAESLKISWKSCPLLRECLEWISEVRCSMEAAAFRWVPEKCLKTTPIMALKPEI